MGIETLKKFILSDNLTDELDDQELKKLGAKVYEEYRQDEQSRAGWVDLVSEGLKLAKQTVERKTFPFDGASNVKYPLLTIAPSRLAATLYPQVVYNGAPIGYQVIGQDGSGLKAQKAARRSAYLNYLLMNKTSWEDGMDRLLHAWSVAGTYFKKIYYDPFTKKPCVELCLPEDIVVNQGYRCLEDARRITHKIYLHKNAIVSRINAGIFRDVDIKKLNEISEATSGLLTDPTGQVFTPDLNDPDHLHCFLEQHRWYDLDGDGYQEPYIVTVHKDSQEVMRMVACYNERGITLSPKDKVIEIKAKPYFVDYHFLLSPDGGFYSIGFGTILTPMNESINTLINQLVDAGTLANTQSGLVARSLKLGDSQLLFKMGSFQTVDVGSSTDIGTQIYPFPFKEPSQVLLSLLQLLIDAANQVASITDVMMGDQPQQNVPATTTIESLRQGYMVFNSIQKRLFRSLKKEFQILDDLVREYGDPEEYKRVLDDPQADFYADFEDDQIDIIPTADPNLSSASERLARVNALVPLVQAFPGVLNMQALAVEYLEGLQFKNPERFLAPPPEGPSVEEQVALGELEVKKGELANKQQQTALKGQQNQIKAITEAGKQKKLETDSLAVVANVKLNQDRLELDQERFLDDSDHKSADRADKNEDRTVDLLKIHSDRESKREQMNASKE